MKPSSHPVTKPATDLLVGRIFGVIPAQFIWMIVIAVATWILLNRHRFGAHTYLIGDNPNSAELMGVNVGQRRILMFGLVGAAAGKTESARDLPLTADRPVAAGSRLDSLSTS